jgi:hypothetical protein
MKKEETVQNKGKIKGQKGQRRKKGKMIAKWGKIWAKRAH